MKDIVKTEDCVGYNPCSHLVLPTGDILGRALKNLDGLLSMPYGCGEQNMALLAPNIYILEYLTNTQQITEEIKARATNFLTSGKSPKNSCSLDVCTKLN